MLCCVCVWRAPQRAGARRAVYATLLLRACAALRARVGACCAIVTVSLYCTARGNAMQGMVVSGVVALAI
jgi:hypothetical protein